MSSTSSQEITQPPAGALHITPPLDWPQFSVSQKLREIVSSLNAVVEGESLRTIGESTFHRKFGVGRVMIAGSTSRGTYAALPVDFDLAVITERAQEEIPDIALKLVCDEIVRRISFSPSYLVYCEVLAEMFGADPVSPIMELESLGLRGTASLVARYTIKMGRMKSDARCGFLDVTCGRLPHLSGYEGWIRGLFNELGSEWAERLRAEIRLTKVVLGKAGELYGSRNRGVRGHAVEQLVIQSIKYRPTGLPIGTFDNAMRLICEEGLEPGSTGTTKTRPFEDFKRQFPLWRPGGNDREGRPVNLWDLVGDGVQQRAEERWRILCRLAEAYRRSTLDSQAWSIADLIGKTRSVL